MERTLSALIFGSTGAVGNELVKHLLNSSKWERVHCVVRKDVPEWSALKNSNKLKLQIENNMDKLADTKSWQFQNFDVVFCCLGSQTKHGQQTFIKIDKTYPLQIADIALHNKIPHYVLVSSTGADSSSWFLYPRTKGQVQNDLKTKKLNILSIFRPGLLLNRTEPRFMQRVGSIIPFFPKIDTSETARCLMLVAEKHVFNPNQLLKQKIYENSEMLQILQKEKA